MNTHTQKTAMHNRRQLQWQWQCRANESREWETEQKKRQIELKQSAKCHVNQVNVAVASFRWVSSPFFCCFYSIQRHFYREFFYGLKLHQMKLKNILRVKIMCTSSAIIIALVVASLFFSRSRSASLSSFALLFFSSSLKRIQYLAVLFSFHLFYLLSFSGTIHCMCMLSLCIRINAEYKVDIVDLLTMRRHKITLVASKINWSS